jgi:AraC-like DNA-binding protein
MSKLSDVPPTRDHAVGITPRERALQQEMLTKIGDARQFLALLEHVPKGLFFMKDTEGLLIWASSAMLPRYGVRNLDELIGKTDYDFFPKQTSANFIRDDREVMQTGKPILRRAEISYTESRTLRWVVTSKFPLRDRKGKVIGVIGISENSGNTTAGVMDQHLGRAIAHIEQHHRTAIPVDDLAAAAGLSPRQLLRRFRDEFGVSPQEFMLRARIHAACDELLQKDATVTRVAGNFGFCDQSAFTRQFRQVTGLTPMAYQREYGQRRKTAKS